MITTVTLWTLLVWAETMASSSALSSTQVPGFANREACLAAMGTLRDSNIAVLATNNRRVGESGIDIKLMVCIPVTQERAQNSG